MTKIAALILAALLPIGCADIGHQTEGNLTLLRPKSSAPDVTSTPDVTTTGGHTTKVPATESDPPITTTAPDRTDDPPIPPGEYTAEILAVGDNIFHSQLVNQGNKLGYDHPYSGMTELISAADLAIINQETVLTTLPPSGYPTFATPQAVGDAAIRAGFDVFTCATNHTWDQGLRGVQDTLDYFAAHPEVTEVGLNNSQAERNSLDIVEVNGISIAIFNFGTLINTKSEGWWRANYLDKSDTTKNWIAGQIAKAKKQADFVIVCAHWGDEITQDRSGKVNYTPVEQETYWAQFFADCEVDLIIGTHPHAVQPVMEVEGATGYKTLVYYSLGNFLHAQNDMWCNVGGLAKVRLYKGEDGKVTIVGYDLIATTVDCQTVNGVECYVARLLSDMTDEMLASSWKWGGKGVTVADFEAIFEVAVSAYPNQTPAAA